MVGSETLHLLSASENYASRNEYLQTHPISSPKSPTRSMVVEMPIFYIFTNAVMPDLEKIGRTDGSTEDRARQLSAATGVPMPFEVFFAAEVDDAAGWERALHEAFDDRRVNAKREFFRISPDKPVAISKMLHTRNVTPKHDIAETKEDLEALDRERRREVNFSFSNFGIEKGSTLQSVFDDSIVSEVAGERSVLFRNEITSLSKSALTIANEKGFHWKTIRGPQYWKYEGRTLLEIREEGPLEGEKS